MARNSPAAAPALLSGAVSRREMLSRLGYLGLSTASLALLPGCPGGSTWLPREERERLAKEAAASNGAAGGAVSIPAELRLSAADYSAAGVHQWSAGALKGFILKDAAGAWLALSRTCTHSRCPVSWRENEGDFFCRCHKSEFDAGGAVVKGPAKRDLPRYPVREEGNELVIDLSGAGPADIEKVKGASRAAAPGDTGAATEDGQEAEDGKGRGRGRGGGDDDADRDDDDNSGKSGDDGNTDAAAPGWEP